MLYGMPYPIEKHPLGLLYSQQGIDQVRSDLLTLLLTNPGERVMLPQFGTPLRSIIFDPNDETTAISTRDMILNAIKTWEPRIAIKGVNVTNRVNENGLPQNNILLIRIEFIDPGHIEDVQVLILEVPLST